MNAVTEKMPDPLVFTDAAASKVKQLYLAGAEIDYQENVEGAQFVIKNPNATSTCGCGSSFSA
ncbi:MAG: hypothetical protein HYU76_04470 [Betaproteobacteria bacterium]|nr:hypothetical protein [Betaproteobacteria bacterium]